MPSQATVVTPIKPGADQPSTEELVQRARDLIPLLARNAAQTERDRRAHAENIEAIAAAGLFKLMVPKRYGGYERDTRAHLEVTAALAEGCGGTAWVVALTNVCNWFTGMFGKQAQDEVFGANPDARVAGVFAPNGTTRREGKGLLVSGKWYWSSGSLHADWLTVGILEQSADGTPPVQYMALIPRADVTIEDTWYTAGMRGSGSNCIVAQDVFVPDHRLMRMDAAIDGDYPTEFKDEAAYRSAFLPVASLVLIGAQLGIGRAALKYVIEKAPVRNIAYTSFAKQTDSVTFHNQVAEAAMRIESAQLHAFRAAADIDECARRGDKMDYMTRARVRADAGLVATLVPAALDILLSAHGAGSFAEASPMQRWWRDSNTAARHAVIMPCVGMEVYGKALLGVENTVTPLV